jgi:hypothetical protein
VEIGLEEVQDRHDGGLQVARGDLVEAEELLRHEFRDGSVGVIHQRLPVSFVRHAKPLRLVGDRNED